MTKAEKFYRDYNDLPIHECPELGEGDLNTIHLMEAYADDSNTDPLFWIILYWVFVAFSILIIAWAILAPSLEFVDVIHYIRDVIINL